ncbi:MAG: apolipoprotein N-acyltransferase [Saprospiraceae bacterium]
MKLPFRPTLAIPSLILFVVSAWRIYANNAAEQLWGWLPFIFLLAGWGLIVSLRQNKNRLRYLAIASLAGLCLGLGFPPLPTWPLMGLGFGLMLFLTDELYRSGFALRRQWWYTYHAFVLFNVLASWWVANTALAAGVVANFLNALLMAVPWAIIFLVRKHMPKIWLPASVVLWIGFEYIHYNWQIAWPWLTFGNAMASTPSLAQWYSYTGIFGGSLYITVIGVLLFKIFQAKRLGEALVEPTVIAGLCVIVPLLISIGLGASFEPDTNPENARIVTAIQPNFEPHYQKFAVPDADQLKRFMKLSQEAPASDLYVFPETSFGAYDESQLAKTGMFQAWSSLRQNPTKAGDLLAGISSYRRYAKPIENPALRTQEGARGNSYYTMHNSAVSIFNGKEGDLYHKSRLVPGVEFLPYRRAMFFFEPLVKSLGGTTAGLGISDSAMVFEYPSGIKAAPLICYESIYGDYVREFVQAGANLLVVPTNDGWWDDSPGHVQHLQFAQLRAIENRRWVVQSANTGISAIINSKGEVTAETKYNEAIALTGRVQLETGDTVYTAMGDQIGRVAAGMSAFLLIGLISAFWRKRAGVKAKAPKS